MKRKIYKALLSIIFAASLLFSFSHFVLAEDLSEEINVTNTEDLSNEDINNKEENTFNEIYLSISENSDKIFSLFSFLGTIIIAIIYKKGLMPGLKKAVSSVSDALSAIKKESEKTSAESSEYRGQINSLSEKTEEAITELECLREELSVEKSSRERGVLMRLLYGQIELLSDIFMSSSLPEYKKEEVGTRINKMKEAMKNEEFIAK